MFSCEFCQIFKNTYFYRTPLVSASGIGAFNLQKSLLKVHYFIFKNHS